MPSSGFDDERVLMAYARSAAAIKSAIGDPPSSLTQVVPAVNRPDIPRIAPGFP